MDYFSIEKVIHEQILDVAIQVSIASNREGYIYSCLENKGRKIKIGFLNSIGDLNSLVLNPNFSSFKSRKGSTNELKILKETLNELGYIDIKNSGIFNYSEKLSKYLKILGWPILIEDCKPKKYHKNKE